MSEIIFNPPAAVPSLQSQIDNLQTTLASLNQQVIILQETIQEKDQKIAELEDRLAAGYQTVKADSTRPPDQAKKPADQTLTILGLLISLYKFIFLPGKV